MSRIRRASAASSGSDQTIFPASPTTLTALNIVTELEKGYAMLPVKLRYDTMNQNLLFYITYDLYRQYQQAQAE